MIAGVAAFGQKDRLIYLVLGLSPYLRPSEHGLAIGDLPLALGRESWFHLNSFRKVTPP